MICSYQILLLLYNYDALAMIFAKMHGSVSARSTSTEDGYILFDDEIRCALWDGSRSHEGHYHWQ